MNVSQKVNVHSDLPDAGAVIRIDIDFDGDNVFQISGLSSSEHYTEADLKEIRRVITRAIKEFHQ